MLCEIYLFNQASYKVARLIWVRLITYYAHVQTEDGTETDRIYLNLQHVDIIVTTLDDTTWHTSMPTSTTQSSVGSSEVTTDTGQQSSTEVK